jgi:endoglucanase
MTSLRTLPLCLLSLAGSLAALMAAAFGEECHYPDGFSRGISLASGEFNPNQIPGVYTRDYIYPPVESIDYYKSRGFDLIRLPFRWERLQPTLFGDFNRAELGRIRQFVDAAQARCVRILLSPHNFGRYVVSGQQVRIGTNEVPDAAFADFWKRMAIAFKDQPNVFAFSLMNEPFDMHGTWRQSAQAGLDAIRSVDTQRRVLAPGEQWSGAWSWQRYNNDFLLHDPADRLIYEAHQYFDADYSGTYRQDYDHSGATAASGIDLVRPFVDWLNAHHAKGTLAEFGVPNDDPRWRALVDKLLPWLAQNDVSWIYWAGGPWWGNYPLSAEPRAGQDAPIMAILTKYGTPVARADQPGMRAPDPH